MYAFSIAANVLLSFFPFLIVTVSLSRAFFDRQTTIAAIDFAIKDYFPDALGQFLHNNLPARRPLELISIVLLLFTANGVFEPLEVALNRVWGIRVNRSFLKNQLVSMLLIFVCGGLMISSVGLTALRNTFAQAGPMMGWPAEAFFKLASVPLMALVLVIVYRFLPNGRPPWRRIVPAAIAVGLLLELLKYANGALWPAFNAKLENEYGVFKYSVTLIFQGFLSSMLVLAGAEWAARGHQIGPEES